MAVWKSARSACGQLCCVKAYSLILLCYICDSFLDNHTFQDEIITKKVRSLDVGIDAFIYLPWIKACAK